MKRKDFDQYMDEARFAELFISEMGWDNPSNPTTLPLTIDDVDYDFVPVADKSSFHIYTCTLPSVPTAAECKKIDNKLRMSGPDYICIFIEAGTHHHLWLTPVKTNEKRELVKTEYDGGAKAQVIWEKIDGLTFELTERMLITDVKQRVQGSFHLNSEKVTKDFYTQFRKEHTAFKKYITGIDEDKNRDWYASVMLNRLMFCYFIQKKGFLNRDTNYLQSKLRWVKEQQGEDQFFGTFYKGFLCSMFHDGLNHPQHDSQDFLKKYGRIPYLNGGMFDDHQLERENEGIDIADVAFENLFNFFDKWNWHLDTRLSASGKDINPDVLGYIFEQYINDRAQMGAYYTKEDITEYIGKNCIIPFLMDKTESATQDAANAFKPNGFVWTMLRESGDKYIYDAVKKGYSSDWQQRVPHYIYKGIDTTLPDLLERRSRWNEKTHDEFALPTEIWRETVERLQRCDSLIKKIADGEIHSINDFITYNLDIRSFTEDVIRRTSDHLFIAHFYHALQNVSILDPTCGSGAFLFAALNILEPLYEACIDRMEDFNRSNQNLFKDELDAIKAKYSSNRQYFIYKSIILRNLYGVDIMVEATEIAKLRLFLKMVAVVDVDPRKDNLGLDPLPDIDFNIKCGNTLVGYATKAELDKDLQFGDMFAIKEFKEKIAAKMQVVASAYKLFRDEQLKPYDDNASIKAFKDDLRKRLAELNELLNKHMHSKIARGTDYAKWEASHQPFHWLAEFYQIIQGNGGFDVIIGNPPYVEYNKKDKSTGKAVSDLYKIQDYKTESCGNLYAFVIERVSNILVKRGKTGMIIPHSAICTDRMETLCKILIKGGAWFSTYDTRPSTLFDGVDQRLLIYILGGDNIYSTTYNRWYTQNRPLLLNNIKYTTACISKDYLSISKFSWDIELDIFKKVTSHIPLSKQLTKTGRNSIYYHNAPRYFLRFAEKAPYFYSDKVGEQISGHIKTISVDSQKDFIKIVGALNSSLFFWWFTIFSNCRDLVTREIISFCVPNCTMDKDIVMNLLRDYHKKAYRKETIYKTTGRVVYDEYYPSKSKTFIDEIDKALAKHYGFTDEELDFIINYDIKYRMGDELNDN